MFPHPAVPGPLAICPALLIHVLNLFKVLEGAIERVIRPAEDDEPSQEVPLGLYIIRGDNVCVVGLVDEALDDSINWAEVRGEVIGTTKHS